MNNSPVKSELYVALEMVELTQFLPFTKFVHILKKINRLFIIIFENFFYLFSVKLKKVKNHIQLIQLIFD